VRPLHLEREALGECQALIRFDQVTPEQVTRREDRFVRLAAVGQRRDGSRDRRRRLDRLGRGEGRRAGGDGRAEGKGAGPDGDPAAAAGLAGGIALGSRMLSRPKTSGVPTGRSRALKAVTGRSGALKSVAREVQEVGKEIGKAGFRLGVGDVSMEVQSGRKKEQRDSPLEVLLHGLTNRRSKR